MDCIKYDNKSKEGVSAEMREWKKKYIVLTPHNVRQGQEDNDFGIA